MYDLAYIYANYLILTFLNSAFLTIFAVQKNLLINFV